MDFVLVKKLQEPIELSDAHPFDQIDMLRENGIGLATKCSRYDFFYTSFSRPTAASAAAMSIFSDSRAMSVKTDTASDLISTKPSPIAIDLSRPPFRTRSSPGTTVVSSGTCLG